jgi:flagellar hook-basal body complex protein FliE
MVDSITSKAVAAYKLANSMQGAGGSKAAMNLSKAAVTSQRMEPEAVGTVQKLAPETPVQPQFDALVAAGLEKARSAGYSSEAVSTEAIAEKAELHELVTSVANAELTLNTVVALRDKLVTAYQDIIKMPI